MGQNAHHHHHHHYHHHHHSTTCHGAAQMDTMKDFIVHFDWMDFFLSEEGEGRRAPTK